MLAKGKSSLIFEPSEGTETVRSLITALFKLMNYIAITKTL